MVTSTAAYITIGIGGTIIAVIVYILHKKGYIK